MKKLLSMLLVLVLLLPTMALAEIDWTGMDAATIQMEIDRARAEILTRDIKLPEKGTVLVDADGVVVTLTSAAVEKSWDGSYGLVLNYTVANNSDKAMGFRDDDCYINGWKVSGSISSSLEAGKKAKESATIYHIDVDADVTTIEEIEELQITFLTFDASTFMTETNDIQTTIYFK